MLLSYSPTFLLSYAFAQPAPLASRNWRPDERSFITDLTTVTAVAATRNVVYAATPNGLAVYDRAFREWKETIGPLDGYPSGPITAMAADPNEDTAWLAGPAQWIAWTPFARRLERGPLPGLADAVVLDARDPSRGAWFHTGAGWYFVARGGLAAEPARDLPASRITGLTYQQLVARIPAIDAVRFRIERDEQLRSYRLTAAAVAPLTNEIFVGSDGNGAFKVDPVSYAVDRLPIGILGASSGSIAVLREDVCVTANARSRSAHHGITCFDESVGHVQTFESTGLSGLPGTVTRHVVVTQRAIWVATDQGLIRADRRGGRPQQIVERDGLPSHDVWALVPARTGVWVGTARGLALMSDTGRAIVAERTITTGPVLSLASAWDTLWAGTPHGLALLPPGGEDLLMVDGPPQLHEAIVAVAFAGDTIVAATASQFIGRSGGEWRVWGMPGRPIGRITAMASDSQGVWVAGMQGFAYFAPGRGTWNALVLPGDVPFPVYDIAASARNIWIATEVGVVRYDRRALR